MRSRGSLYAAMKPALHALGWLAFGLYGRWARNPQPRLPLPRNAISKILVIRLDLLGDVVFSIPAIEALAGAFPIARVDALVLPYTAPILRRVDAVGVLDELDINRFRRPRGWLHVGDLIRLVRALRSRHYDLAVGLSGIMGGVFAALSGARLRVGYAAETYRGCYNVPIPGRRYETAQHEVDYCLDLVRALVPPVEVDVPTDPIQRTRETSFGSGRVPRIPVSPANARPLAIAPYAVLVPGASNGAAKRWPAPHWSVLGDRLKRVWGLDVVISGSATERPLAESVARGMGSPSDVLAGGSSIDELIDLLARAVLVVSGDTGPLHVAAAVGTPCVGIYGPTDPTNTGPLSSEARVVRLGLSCSPCYDLRSPAECKLPDRSIACMWGLDPNRVFEAVREVLGPPAPGRAIGSEAGRL
ncbi:MAG: lipopolysaccharide heptosyltransferase II [Chloroflexi bacterium]|nr:lipopolysaccharide heptosyltransferase II [Chloroflexota bacterium]